MPPRLFTSPVKITVQMSKGKGRGVFATARIRAGEIIETAPVLLVPKSEADTLAGTFLGHYMFQTDNHKHYVIGLGLTSMVNHGDEPNAEFFATIDHVVVKATRAIPVGAEVTIDYGWGEAEWASIGIVYKPKTQDGPQ